MTLYLLEDFQLDVWIQIMLISLGITILSQFTNKLMKLDSQHMKATQTRLRELSQELEASRGGGTMNYQVGTTTRSYDEINRELMSLMKKMAKEQFLPMGIRCGVFWGIFAIIGVIYGPAGTVLPFDFIFFGHEWVGAYVMFSLIFGFSIFGLQKLYKKLTHQDQKPLPEGPVSSRISTPAASTPAARPAWKERLESAKKEPQ